MSRAPQRTFALRPASLAPLLAMTHDVQVRTITTRWRILSSAYFRPFAVASIQRCFTAAVTMRTARLVSAFDTVSERRKDGALLASSIQPRYTIRPEKVE